VLRRCRSTRWRLRTTTFQPLNEPPRVADVRVDRPARVPSVQQCPLVRDYRLMKLPFGPGHRFLRGRTF